MEKYCKRCDTTKPVSEFNKRADTKDGLGYSCRQCNSQAGKEHYEKNKERYKKNAAAWKEKNPDKLKEYAAARLKKNPDYLKEWNQKNPDKAKEYAERDKLRRYGLTIEDYNNLLAQQNNRCAICKEESKDGRSLHVDHDHSCCKGRGSCGKCVRGLLCVYCNSMLGYARDNPETLGAGQNYLKRNSKAKISEMILDHQNF